MITIYKYQLNPSPGLQEIKMPRGARVLSVQEQANQIQVWAVVNTDHPEEGRYFRLHMTGDDASQSNALRLPNAATVQLDGGLFVLHVFW